MQKTLAPGDDDESLFKVSFYNLAAWCISDYNKKTSQFNFPAGC